MAERQQADSWSEWSKVVLTELERLTESNKKLVEEFQEFKLEIAQERASKQEVESLKTNVAQAISSLQIDLNSLRVEHINKVNESKNDLQNKISSLENDHSVKIAELKSELKFKAGVWGALAGLIPVVIGLASWLLSVLVGN